MEHGPIDVCGAPFCLDWTPEYLTNIYPSAYGYETLSSSPQPYGSLDPNPALEFKPSDDFLSDASLDSEPSSIMDIAEAPDVYICAPKMGYLHQCDINSVLEFCTLAVLAVGLSNSPASTDTHEAEKAKSGELLWSPEQLTDVEVDRYLGETQCFEDIDDYLPPWRNRLPSGIVADPCAAQDADLDSPQLCTQEEALHVLHLAGYDVERAKSELTARNLVWSAKKRDIAPWEDQDVLRFESNMRLNKPFHDMARHMPGKSVKDLLHFYYTWKTTPRCEAWWRSFTEGLPVIDQPPAFEDAPSIAFPDDFSALRLTLGPRSRPRVDYQPSTDLHAWPSSGGRKRRHGHRDESSDTADDDRSLLPYELRVDADINLEALRMSKRRRVHEDGSYTLDASLPAPSDESLMMEVDQHERDALCRGTIELFADEPSFPFVSWELDR